MGVIEDLHILLFFTVKNNAVMNMFFNKIVYTPMCNYTES